MAEQFSGHKHENAKQTGKNLSKWQQFAHFAWESETRKFFGRSGVGWMQIVIYYLVFYCVSFGFFYVILWVYLRSLPIGRPKLVLGTGLSYLMNPGLQTIPRGLHGGAIDATLIAFRPNDANTYSDFVKQLKDTLQEYMIDRQLPVAQACASPYPAEMRNCSVGMAALGSCADMSSNFGYDVGQPCILLRLNKVIGWVPHPYAASTVAAAQEVLPVRHYDSVTNITTYTDPTHGNATVFGYGPSDGSHVMVTCQELVTARDTADTITGVATPRLRDVRFFPSTGLSANCFPFCTTLATGPAATAYLPPVVMARFNVTTNVPVIVWCRAWAGNLEHDVIDRTGGVVFQLLVVQK